MDYIDQEYIQTDIQNDSLTSLSNDLLTRHHLQPFHPDYFKTEKHQEKFFSYSAENCEAAIALTSEQQKITSLFSEPLPAPADEFKQVELYDLIRFFSHPVRYLLVKIVGIAPIEESQGLEVSEPFMLKGLIRYKLENEILEQLLKGHSCDKLYNIKKAAGELPHGQIGKIYFEQLVSELQSFYQSLAELISGQELKQRQVNLSIGDYRITGHLENTSHSGLIQYRYATVKSKDVIRSWISHLVLNSLQESEVCQTGSNTFLAGKNNIFKYVPTAESKQHLEDLLDLYWQGLTEPLYFFPHASFVFAQEIHKGKNEQEALQKAIIEWEGDDFNKKGEKNDPYNQLCCKNMKLSNPLFMAQAKKVFLAAFALQEKHS
jgi:exodeoxyribonuclease V gamma subunit